MPKVSDIKDPMFKALLEDVDRLIDSGEYVKAARKCAETSLQLLAKRPDFTPPPPNPRMWPQYTNDLPPSHTRGSGGGPAANSPTRSSWPSQGGIKIIFDEERKPSIVYEKERFSLSEAASYFEFIMEEVVRADLQPPPA